MSLKDGELWDRLVDRSARALEAGAIRPIETDWQIVPDAGVQFVLRVVTNLQRKEAAKTEVVKKGEPGSNPFLPYDRRLWVADLSETHVGLLNKFNVLDHHLLVVTRAFEEQESPLSRADFEALWICLAAFDGLGFYNSGRQAGASQPHKHLQVVPLPLSPAGPPIPIETLLDTSKAGAGQVGVTGIPFRHCFVRLENAPSSPAAAARCFRLYSDMRGRLGLDQKQPYNLLVTRRWMLMVPRRSESFESISVNTLGFAGSLFVGSRRLRDRVIEVGPMRILKEVTAP